jgi:hypothetical protein
MHAQNDLFCAPEPIGTDVRAAAPNGGSRALRSLEATTQRDGRATFITLHRSAAGIRR